MGEGPIPHSILRSLIGARPDQMERALNLEGFIRRPLPPGRDGYRLLGPGKLPGAKSNASFLPGGCGYRTFSSRPEAWLVILNSAAEQAMLSGILEEWAGYPSGRGYTARLARPAERLARRVLRDVYRDRLIARLAGAASGLAREGLIKVYRDPLQGEQLTLLDSDRASRELADPLNWWRDEDNPDVPPAGHLIVLDITGQGQRALAAA